MLKADAVIRYAVYRIYRLPQIILPITVRYNAQSIVHKALHSIYSLQCAHRVEHETVSLNILLFLDYIE